MKGANMITKEMAVEYLNRITEAKKTLDTPFNPELSLISEDNAFWCYHGFKRLLIDGTQKLAEAVGHPYIRKSANENADYVLFHWNGIEIYDLDFNKRIKHIA